VERHADFSIAIVAAGTFESAGQSFECGHEHGVGLDVALDSGFGDLSNFNRAVRAEFGVSPRAYRRRAG
jgi:methylphosphotriester-DNA--protein-cysteine methyltransferase